MLTTLDFNRRSDEQIATITDSDRTELMQSLGRAGMLCHTLVAQLKDSSLTNGFTATGLSLLEFLVQDLSNKTSIPCETAQEVNNRSKRLREQNELIHKMQEERGAAAADHVKDSVATLCRALRRWWSYEGFGYASKIGFDEYGHLVVTFSGRPTAPDAYGLSDEEGPSCADWLAQLVARGFEFEDITRTRDLAVLDTPQSRAALVELIATIPSANITCIESRCDRSGAFVLDRIKVLVRDPVQVLALVKKSA